MCMLGDSTGFSRAHAEVQEFIAALGLVSAILKTASSSAAVKGVSVEPSVWHVYGDANALHVPTSFQHAGAHIRGDSSSSTTCTVTVTLAACRCNNAPTPLLLMPLLCSQRYPLRHRQPVGGTALATVFPVYLAAAPVPTW